MALYGPVPPFNEIPTYERWVLGAIVRKTWRVGWKFLEQIWSLRWETHIKLWKTYGKSTTNGGFRENIMVLLLGEIPGHHRQRICRWCHGEVRLDCARLARHWMFFFEEDPFFAGQKTKTTNLASGKLTVCYWKWPFTVDLPIKKDDFP